MEEGLQIAITPNVEQLNSYLRKHGGVFLRAGLEGTLYTLAVRPLSRPALLLGKFAGQAAMLMIYAALFFLALAGLVYW